MNRLNKILFSLIGPMVCGEPPHCYTELSARESLDDGSLGSVASTDVKAPAVANSECGPSCLTDEKALAALFALAKKHDLAHLLASAVRKMQNAECKMQNSDCVSDELSAELAKAEYTAIYRVKNIVNEQGRVRKCLEDAGIPFILLKGSVTRGYYPEPWMRTSSDIDVLVPEDKLSEVVKLITKALDYRISTVEPHDASLFARSGVHLDVHTLIEGDTEDRKLLTRVWASARTEGGAERFMSGEYFYFHHISHMAKHMKNGGCGIRPFIDLYLIKNNVTYDKDAVAELLHEFGLDRFESAASRLAAAWMTGGSEEGLEAMEEYILTGGVYGSRDQYVAARQRGKRSKLHYLTRRIFMPYDELKRRYTVLEKHRWLTPFFEVLRWLSLLDPKRLGRTKQELDSTARLNGERIASVETLLLSLGL